MNQFEHYTKQLKSPKKKKRASAALNLGLLGNNEAINYLEKSLTDPYPPVRSHSVIALSKFDDSRVLNLLITALADPDDQVYGCAASALSRIGNETAIRTLVNEVYGQENPRRSIATNNLIKVGEPAVASLITAFYNSSGETRAYFLKALGKIGDVNASKVFVNAVLDENYDVFWVATAILRDIPIPDAIPALVASLEHEERIRQARAASTLQHVGDERAVEALLNVAIDKNRDEHVRSAAFITLGKIGGSEAFEPLQKALEESDWIIHWSALIGLSYTGDPRIVRLLLDYANRKPDDIGYHTAIRNLGTTGSQLTLREFELILGSKNHYDLRVQQTAKECMDQLRQIWNM